MKIQTHIELKVYNRKKGKHTRREVVREINPFMSIPCDLEVTGIGLIGHNRVVVYARPRTN